MKKYKDQIASCLDLLLLLLNAPPKDLRAQAAPLRLFRLFPGFVVSSSQSRNADPPERPPLRGLFLRLPKTDARCEANPSPDQRRRDMRHAMAWPQEGPG